MMINIIIIVCILIILFTGVYLIAFHNGKNHVKREFYSYQCRNCEYAKENKLLVKKAKEYDDLAMELLFLHTTCFSCKQFVSGLDTLVTLKEHLISYSTALSALEKERNN